MTSKERHEIRYQRRKAKRIEKLKTRNKSFEDVFSYQSLFRGYKRSIAGVGWKPSTQIYKANASLNIYNTHCQIINGTWKSRGFVNFTIVERGKLRHIRAVHISERVVQHALCDELLVPVITPSLIYDNSGSIKGKGVDFALNRCKKKLRKALKTKKNVYILTYDFHHYFDEIDHSVAMSIIDKYVLDKRCREFAKHFIYDFGSKGLGLGSQISQILAVSVPNQIDNELQKVHGVIGYGRYMDDGYIISTDKSVLHTCLNVLQCKCKELHITINEKKLQICKLSKGFVFLKHRFYQTRNGRIRCKEVRSTGTNGRRRLHKLFKKVLCGIITRTAFDRSYASMRGAIAKGDNLYALKRFDNLYFDLMQKEELNDCIKA